MMLGIWLSSSPHEADPAAKDFQILTFISLHSSRPSPSKPTWLRLKIGGSSEMEACHIPARAATASRARLHRTTILSALGPDHTITVLFLGTHTRTSQWVTHHGIALVRSHFNFGVPMESEASELPKGLVLSRDENIHIRHR
ncbi:hypothetical protein ACFX2B_009841 [Malus domestica]